MAEQISGSLGGAENEESSTSTPEAPVAPVEGSEETTTPVAPEAPVAPVEGSEAPVDDDDDDDNTEDEDSPITRRKARGLRSENRNLRIAKKELASENETLKTRLTELEEKVSGYETTISENSKNQMLSDIKSKFGLSDRQAKYLTGSNADELEKSAKELVEDLGIATPDYSRLKTPAGTGPASSVLSMSEEEIVKQFS